jgi:CheY-like chemotaxis protein
MESGRTRFILIVEDHLSTATVMTRLVRARGFHVLTAGSIAEARRLAAANEIGFVISDLGLADGDGCDLMMELNALCGVRGAAVTGYGRPPDQERSRAAGFVLHLVKPIQAAELEPVLEIARRELGDPRMPLPGIH